MAQEGDGNVKFTRMYDEQTTDSDNDVTFKTPSHRARPARWSTCSGETCWPKEPQSKQLALLLAFCALLIAGLITALVVVTVVDDSSAKPSPPETQTGSQTCLTPDCVAVASEILAKMNLSALPCDDFYSYACGGWMHNTFFPPEKPKWSSFMEVYISNIQLLKKLLEAPGNAYGNFSSSSAVRKAKDYYAACMNRTAYESLGGTPLNNLIASLGSWPLNQSQDSQWNASAWSFQDTLVRLHKLDVAPFFAMTVGPDDRNSSINRILFQQNGLTLSSKDQYNSSNTAKLKAAFVDFGAAMVELLNPTGLANRTRQRMEKIWDLESRLASAFVPPELLRDPIVAYNDMSVGELQTRLGNTVNLTAYLRAMLNKDIRSEDRVLVYTPTYFDKLNGVLQEYLSDNDKKSTLTDYMIWLLVVSTSSYLSEDFRQSRLILSAVTDGVTSLSARWELCVSRTDNALGFATGAMYVSSNFKSESKRQVESILEMVRQSFAAGFPSVDWMDPKTRTAAVEKAEFIVSKVGYPEWLPNVTALDYFYNELITTPDNQYSNYLSSLQFGVNYRLSKLGAVPDRNEWTMAPAEVNAYYNPPYNVIVFPAGILQKPFYDSRYPMSANLGGVGSVVGHEITHAFDDQGGLYDKYGNLAKWWENASVVAFSNQTQCMRDQYSNYFVGTEKVNGQLTMGENIADNGGLKAAYRSLLTWLSSQSIGVSASAQLPGLNLTHAQLFFVSYAQVWCSYYQPEYAQVALLVDPHSPARYRVIGPLSNSEYFASAFSCPAGSNMNPSKKCTVW